MGKTPKNKPKNLPMRTPDLVEEKYAALTALFPNAITETIDENGAVVRAIDADVLAQEINTHVVSGREERYQFTWPDKKKSMLLANTPIAAALRPCREESVDFDDTENLYIEGDNLKVLKLLRETYLNRVKMIYIDPPYNTGKDFLYADKWAVDSEEWSELSGNYDEGGNRLVRNLDSNGRFHSDWLNMMYPRLRVARDLLTDDGVMFISIDDNEAENLKKMCNEVFGETNFLAQIIWERAYAPINLKKHFSESHDYIICYAKNLVYTVCNGLRRGEKQNKDYKNIDNDPRGPWKAGNPSVGPAVEKNIYEIISPGGKKMFPPSGRSWLYSKERFQEMKNNNRIYWGSEGDSVWAPKMFLSEVKQGVTPMTVWRYSEVGHSQDATKKLKKMFDGKAYFDYPKSVVLIERCLQLYTDKNCTILDFFSGTATTAHAVMQLNAEDGGKRKFIMVQLPEPCDEKSEAYKAGYKNISEIGKERIRRAGKKIKEENKDKAGIENLDIGFRFLKLDSSNMKKVYYTPEEYAKMNFEIDGFVDNIKSDRSEEDLLFQVMLDLGIPLSAKINRKDGAFHVNGNFLIAFFGRVDTAVITRIAKQQPCYAVFRDSSFIGDSALVNFEQVFSTYSPQTVRRVL